MEPTLHQLVCFDAVVTEGSFQAAAEKIGRAQPSVSAAVKNLESQVGLVLLDRSGYCVCAAHAAMGAESELRVVIGDLCPLPQTLALLRRFFDDCPGTRLHLHFEAITGPWERLFDGDADLILHHIDKADPRLEFMDLFRVRVMPMVAPGFLRFP